MDESILTSIKKMLGIPEDYTHFDSDIMMHINTVFFVLMQLGVGPTNGFSIEDGSEEWSEFLTDSRQLEAVKSYMYMKVRLLFDPPTSSAAIESMNRLISEFEWRLNVAVDPGESSEEVASNG